MVRRHPSAATGVLLVAAAALLGWLGLTGFVWSDYESEALVPLGHLTAGDFSGFLATAPAYGGSLLMRAPFALLPSVWGGGELAVYRAVAAPCLLAGAALGFVLWRARRTRFPGAQWALVFALVAAANPVTLRALDIGHPEELLGAVLCAGAVLAAARQRPHLAALLLGLAIGNKAWAVLAIGPVFVALSTHRLRMLVLAGTIAVALMAPFVAGTGGADRVAIATGPVSTIFQPWQAWWMLGDSGHVVRGGDGHVKPGYRIPPAWLARISHPLIALMVVPFTLLWLVRRRGSRRGAPEDALLLLALLMLLRCVLDPWDTSYYHLPFLLALLSWEAVSRARPPVLSLVATVAVWITFETLPKSLGADAQSLSYLVWTVPAAVALGWACLRGPRPAVARSARSEPLPAVA